VLGAVLVAPFSALVPHLSAGRVAAWIEARLRPPALGDCEGLSQVSSLADWRANRFTRVLLVGFAATAGEVVGACLGAIWVVVRALV
jgi:pheromone shutdown protein TraB